MNKLLAGSLSILNTFLAVAFVVAGATAGYLRFGDDPLPIWLGGGVGLVVAVVFCGLLAVFLDIRSELIALRKAAAIAQSTQASAMDAISMRLSDIHQVLAARAAPPPIPVSASAPLPVVQTDPLGNYQLDSSNPLPSGTDTAPAAASKRD
jgi:hypothetical protein